MRRTAILALCLLSGLLLAGTLGPAPSEGASAACSEADYASLPSGEADGTTCEAQDTGIVWRYSTVAALWLSTDMAPASLLISYEGTALPTAETPAWTKISVAAYSEAVSGGVLTVSDDDSSGYVYYQIVNAGLVNTKRWALVIRSKVNSQGSTVGNVGFKAFAAMRPASEQIGALGFACAAALSTGVNVRPSGSSGTPGPAGTVWTPDNAVWKVWIMAWDPAVKTYYMEELGTGVRSACLIAGGTAIFPANSISFGASTTVSTASLDVDYIRVFEW